MRTVEELIEEVKHLSAQERSRLVEAIGDLDQNGHQDDKANSKASQAAALDAFLALAGTAETEYTDVSDNKYAHLAEIYADPHEDV